MLDKHKHVQENRILQKFSFTRNCNLVILLCRKLGWESKLSESHLDVLARGEVLMALAQFGDETTHKEALRRFESLLNDKNTPLLSADTIRVRENIGLNPFFPL